MQRKFLFLLMVLLLIVSVVPMTAAQRDDRGGGGDDDRGGDDGGGSDDSGGDTGGGGGDDDDDDGGSSGGGGSDDAPVRIPGDFDGDGTPDEEDSCPQEGGPDWNEGCPTDLTAPPTEEATPEDSTDDSSAPEATEAAVPAVEQAVLPTDGDCVLATNGTENVNVREYPGLDAAVATTITPIQTLRVVHMWKTPNGDWYRTLEPAGWIAAIAARLGGDCSTLAMSDFSGGDGSTAAGAIPHWGPLGELTFCLPNYEIGEETCVPPADAAGVVPHWGPLGELTFCLPNYEIGEETCVVFPAQGLPSWNEIGDILYCPPSEVITDEPDCVVISVDFKDGGIVLMDVPDNGAAPPAEPKWHKFLLLGDDGLLVLTAPQDPDAAAGPAGDFPLWLSPCPPSDDDCPITLNAVQVPDLPLAACPYDDDQLMPCSSVDPADIPDDIGFDLSAVVLFAVPYDPDLPLVACPYDDEKVIQCSSDDDWYPGVDPELPEAGCAFDDDKIVQCDNDGTLDPEVEFDFLLAAANGDPQPQTREHILLARQVGVPGAVGAKLNVTSDEGIAVLIGLLLPAVQK